MKTGVAKETRSRTGQHLMLNDSGLVFSLRRSPAAKGLELRNPPLSDSFITEEGEKWLSTKPYV